MRIQDRIHGEQVLSPVKYVTGEDHTILPNENVVLASSEAKEITLTLPSVVDAKGQFYLIRKTQTDNDVKVAQVTGIDQLGGTADLTSGSVDMSNQDDFLFLYSDGIHWILLAEEVN